MDLWTKIVFFFSIFISTAGTLCPLQESTLNKPGTYTVLPELDKLIEQYQSPEFLKEVEEYSHQFESHDFIHKALHPRETALEKIDRLNKKVLYELPLFWRTEDKSIGICYCDVIALSSHFMQKSINKTTVSNFLSILSTLLTQQTIQLHDQIIPMLSENPQAIAALLIDEIWKSQSRKKLLIAYLKQRLPFAALEYLKKLITPPPFFIHGKTTEGIASDVEAELVTPITSIIPIPALDAIISPLVNKILPTSEDFQWNTNLHNQHNTIINIALLYAVEGAKQLEFMSDIDETMLFIMAKEMAISLLFFHRQLYSTTLTLLNHSILLRQEIFKKLIEQHLTIQKDTTNADDIQTKKAAESTEQIKNFFKTILGGHAGRLLTSLEQAQEFYNTTITGALLAPAAFKIFHFCWKILHLPQKKEGNQ